MGRRYNLRSYAPTWLVLSFIIDEFTYQKIVVFSFDRHITTALTTKALQNAYHLQRPSKELIFHSNLGSQYTSESFQEILEHYGMKHSFSYKGSPYDNACIESFHAILKKEEVNHVQYVDENSARIALFQYIEAWYNRERIHGGLDYKTPQEMEEQCTAS